MGYGYTESELEDVFGRVRNRDYPLVQFTDEELMAHTNGRLPQNPIEDRIPDITNSSKDYLGRHE